MYIQQVNGCQNSNYTNFGTFYYDNLFTIERRVGNEWAQGVRKSIPRLNQLAQDVNIYIESKKNFNSKTEDGGLEIHVFEKTPNNIKNPLRRLFYAPAWETGHLKRQDIGDGESIADKIVNEAITLKESLQKNLSSGTPKSDEISD